jgi:hypothetical protein
MGVSGSSGSDTLLPRMISRRADDGDRAPDKTGVAAQSNKERRCTMGSKLDSQLASDND